MLQSDIDTFRNLRGIPDQLEGGDSGPTVPSRSRMCEQLSRIDGVPYLVHSPLQTPSRVFDRQPIAEFIHDRLGRAWAKARLDLGNCIAS
jgi:hypothetical protein